MTNRNHIPTRTCIYCRQVKEKSRLQRFVLNVQGNIQPDNNMTLAGRGAYCCKNAECLHQAIKRGAFSRAFKQYMQIDETKLAESLPWITKNL